MEVGSSTLPGTTEEGGLAQLARASALHAEGQRFESVILHIAFRGEAIIAILTQRVKKEKTTMRNVDARALNVFQVVRIQE